MSNLCHSCNAPIPDHSQSKLCPSCQLAGTSSPSSPDPAPTTPPDPAQRFTAGDILADRYRIVATLGRGGMGEVYRADDLTLKQPVALKFLPDHLATDPKLLDALYNEVRQARRVAHRHICRVYDIGDSAGQPFLTMEFIEGEDLGTLLRRIGRLPGDKGVELARQLAAGLAAAHEEGLLHLDLKPANLMVDGRGNLRITDFGLARLSTDAASSKKRAGTPAYMAPEQLLDGRASERSDLYSLGLVLYEMFTGQCLHATRSNEQITTWHREALSPERPTLLSPNLDPAIESLILSCLAEDPEKRPESADDVLRQLDCIASPTSHLSKSPSSGKKLAAIMFTDIVSSVELQQRLGTAAYTDFITRHDTVFKSCLEQIAAATILNETGDGFLVRFDDPTDAVNTALRLQSRLAAVTDTLAPIQLCIGLNMGVVTEMNESIRGEKRAVGMPINIAARVMDLAGASQILMTRAVYDDARHYVRKHPDDPETPIEWAAHGGYNFKGGDEPLDIYEVGVRGIAPLAPPENSNKAWRNTSAAAADHNLDPAGGDDREPITVSDIENSDVIISYAPVDNRPLIPGREGWVTRLHRNLSVRLEQLCGDEIKVLCCPKSNAIDIPDSVIPSVGQAKTMVPIVSPPFIRSDKCCRVLQAFDLAEPGSRKGLVKAVKTPVPNDDIPSALASVLRDHLDYNFFDEDPETHRVREYDEAFGEEAQKSYYERIYDLAFEVSKSVKANRSSTDSPPDNPTAKTIFLAETTSDLQGARDSLRRELLEQGHTILPDRPLPQVADQLQQALAGALSRADFAIHFVGGRYGWIPEDAAESLTVLQNGAAAKFSAEENLQRVIWIPRDITPNDDRQSAFLTDLSENPETHRGAEVIRDTIENLKEYLEDRWQRERTAADLAANIPSDATTSSASAPRIYLICDARDEEATEPIEDYFFDQGIEVSLPDFSGDEAEISRVHWQNLADCDAVLVYYGNAGKAWVDIKLRELVKAAGYRNGRPIDLQAVLLAPPFDRRKDRFRSLSATVYRQQEETFAPTDLADFTKHVKAAHAPSSS